MKYRIALVGVLPAVLVFAAVLAVSAAPVTAGEFAYVGSKNCKKCHLKEYKSWEATTMATTFETLKPGVRADEKTAAGLDPAMDYTTDAKCVKCHVTGYGKPGGFVDIATTPDLVGVGCESCHGPGGSYVADDLMSLKNKEYKRADLVAAGLVEKVGEAQCTGCHNSESPFVAEGQAFDFEANKASGMHERYELKYSHD